MSGLEERANQYVEHSQDIPAFVNHASADNMFGVSDDLWTGWTDKARLTFNISYLAICEAGIEILHENTCPMPKAEFAVLAMNTAAIAAESLTMVEKYGPGPKLCECI
jgi:hypothetical protein